MPRSDAASGARPHLITERLERARFVSRPNRFLLRYRLGRREGLAHIMNPGRMGEILLPGVDLLLARRPGTRTGREVVGAAWSERWPGDRPRAVYLNAGRVNDLAAGLLEEGLIPELAGWEVLRREYRTGRSRFDFLLGRGEERNLLEVKSVTLVERGLALFPDARTERGRRHLEELGRLGVAGRENGTARTTAGVLFLVQGEADRFLPDFHDDLEFARAFRAAAGKVDLLPYALAPVLTDDGRLSFSGAPRRLAVPEGALDAGIADSGLYLLELHLSREARLEIGGLGVRRIRRGWYVYVGSARRALGKRVARHLRLRKRLHWHVDHLRAAASGARAYPIRAAPVTECELAAAVRALGETRGAESFGASDCGCPGHLAWFPMRPGSTATFQELLTRLRHSPVGAS